MPESDASRLTGLRRGLNETGYVEGRNLVIEYRWEGNQADIGYLNSGSPESDASRLTGLRRGLNETGYVEGRNLVIEYRWAGNQADRLPALAADLSQYASDDYRAALQKHGLTGSMGRRFRAVIAPPTTSPLAVVGDAVPLQIAQNPSRGVTLRNRVRATFRNLLPHELTGGRVFFCGTRLGLRACSIPRGPAAILKDHSKP